MDTYDVTTAFLSRSYKRILRKAEKAYMKRLDGETLTEAEAELADLYEGWIDEYRIQATRRRKNK